MAKQQYKKEKVRATYQAKNPFEKNKKDVIFYYRNLDDFEKKCRALNLDINLSSRDFNIQKVNEIIKNAEMKKAHKHYKSKHKSELFDFFVQNTSLFGFNNNQNIDLDTWEKILKVFQKDKKKFIKNIEKNKDNLEFLNRIVEHKDEWINDIELFESKTKNIDQTIKNLVNYLLFKFPITNNEFLILKEQKLFNDYIKHKSLKKTLDTLKFNIKPTKKHVFKMKEYKTKTNHRNIKELADEVMIFDIVENKTISKDLLHEAKNEFFYEFLHYVKNTVLKDGFFQIKDIKPLYDYLCHKKTYIFNQYNDVLRLKQLNLSRTYHEMKSWHKSLQSSKTKKVYKIWEKSSTIKELNICKYKDETVLKNNPYNYTQTEILELTSEKELISEGKALRHCVGSYANKCHSGRARIYSLRIKEYDQYTIQRKITIEIINGAIVQCRGTSNRRPTKHENEIIYKWAIENNISYY